MFPQTPGPIGLFDSGYGGLTIFDKIDVSAYDGDGRSLPDVGSAGRE